MIASRKPDATFLEAAYLEADEEWYGSGEVEVWGSATSHGLDVADAAAGVIHRFNVLVAGSGTRT